MRKLTWRLARKQGGLSDHLDGPYVLLFCTFMILMFLLLNLIKDWNVSNPLWKQSYHLLIWVIIESPFYYLCLLSSFFFFFLLYHVIFAHNVPLGIFAMPMVLSLIFPKLPFRVFNLVGLFYLNFCLGRPFEISTYHAFPFFGLDVVFLESIHVNWTKHFLPIQIFDLWSTSGHDLLNDKMPRPPWYPRAW